MSGLNGKGMNANATEWTPGGAGSAGGSPTAPVTYNTRRGGEYGGGYGAGGASFNPPYTGGGGYPPHHHHQNQHHGAPAPHMHVPAPHHQQHQAPHLQHHQPLGHPNAGGSGGFTTHSMHSHVPGGHAPAFQGHHSAPVTPHHHHNNYGNSFSASGRPPNPGQFAPHGQAWNNAMAHQPAPVPVPVNARRPVVLIMGAPKSGKKTIGAALASVMGYYHIVPNAMGDWADRFEHLEKEIVDHRNAKGFVISSYGADSDVDLFYLFHVITSQKVSRLEVLHVLYLDYTYAQMEARLQQIEGAYPPSSSVMAAYAMGYELCATHFASLEAGFTLVNIMDQDAPRTTKSILDECIGPVRKVCDFNSSAPIAPPTYAAFDKWTLVTDHKRFRSRLHILDEALSTQAAAGVFPLRNPGNNIDYPKFARHYNQLQSYEVLLATNGQRALIFKIGNQVYALTEMCTCIYTYAGSDVPDTFAKHLGKGEDDLVFAVEADLCTIEHQNNTASHVLLRDVLFHNHRTMERVPTADRREIISTQFGESTQPAQYVLPHVVHPISNISQLVDIVANIENIVVGFRFEHPYGYKPSMTLTDIDTRLFTWSDGEKPLATLRLWKSTEGFKKGPQGDYAVYRFEVLVVDDLNGAEKPLSEYLLPSHAKVTGTAPVRNAILEVADNIVHDNQLNDGMLVECRYTRNAPPPAVKGPAARSAPKMDWYADGYWSFVRRRQDVMYPHYASTVNDVIKKPAWKREELIAACAEIVPKATATA